MRSPPRWRRPPGGVSGAPRRPRGTPIPGRPRPCSRCRCRCRPSPRSAGYCGCPVEGGVGVERHHDGLDAARGRVHRRDPAHRRRPVASRHQSSPVMRMMKLLCPVTEGSPLMCDWAAAERVVQGARTWAELQAAGGDSALAGSARRSRSAIADRHADGQAGRRGPAGSWVRSGPSQDRGRVAAGGAGGTGVTRHAPPSVAVGSGAAGPGRRSPRSGSTCVTAPGSSAFTIWKQARGSLRAAVELVGVVAQQTRGRRKAADRSWCRSPPVRCGTSRPRASDPR